MSKRLLRAFSWIGQFIAPFGLGVLGYPFVAALALLLGYYLVHRMVYPRSTLNQLINWFIGLLVAWFLGRSSTASAWVSESRSFSGHMDGDEPQKT